jgi:DNA-binding transcriptional LysR family regulator
MIDLVRLRSFAHVCEAGTVAAAAAGLGYSPPAVSQHVARLERDLGVTLFDRVGGRLRPTGHGVALQALAARLLDLADQCEQLDLPAGGPVEMTVAGCASAIAELVAPRLASLPDHAVTVRGVDDDRALRDLRLGHAEVAIVQRYDDRLAVEDDPRFRCANLLEEPLRLVLPPGSSPATTLADLTHPRWLLNGDDTACTRSVLRLLARSGIEPTVTGTFEDNHALLKLVAEGHGRCVVPDLVLRSAAPHLDLVAARRPVEATRTILAVTRRLFDPNCRTVLMFSASARALSCASVRPARADGGASRISFNDLSSQALSSPLSKFTETATGTSLS